MQPDYTAMVNEFIKPVAFLLLFIFLILGWVTAFRLMKENTVLRIKLGRDDEKASEDFKIWILRKSAPIVLPLYTLNSFIQEKQFYPALRNRFKKNALKIAFRLQAVTGMVTSIFGINTTGTS